MTASELAAILTGERMMIHSSGAHERPSESEIARRAYALYEMRGRRPGHDVDDWLSAERELLHHYGWPRSRRGGCLHSSTNA